jgi:adenylate kinase
MLCLTATPFLSSESPSENEDLPCLIFFYGPPGSGKDSFSAMIRHEFGLPSVHPGDPNLLQSLEQDDPDDIDNSINDLSSIPDNVLANLLCTRLLDADCTKGALIEDIDLTTTQLTEIFTTLSSKFQCIAVSINADEKLLLKKTEHRMFCKSCGAIYTFPDAKTYTCKNCQKELSIRHDDQPDVVRKKLAEYTKRFQPALTFFEERHLLTEIKALQNFFENENNIRCFIQSKTHIKPNKDNPLPLNLKLWHQATACE